ncbi:MAG: SirA family protein [Firmicutes bacterium]|nr:SirA family protein [Bacillota bacterium]MBO2521716.1 SirA family protein [Bacillota bacterium]
MTQPIQPDRVLDLCGECCPYPPILTMQEIQQMKPGEVLEVIVDHPPSVTTVPTVVTMEGHEVLGEPVRQGAEFHIFIRVKATGSAPAAEAAGQ